MCACSEIKLLITQPCLHAMNVIKVLKTHLSALFEKKSWEVERLLDVLHLAEKSLMPACTCVPIEFFLPYGPCSFYKNSGHAVGIAPFYYNK